MISLIWAMSETNLIGKDNKKVLGIKKSGESFLKILRK